MRIESPRVRVSWYFDSCAQCRAYRHLEPSITIITRAERTVGLAMCSTRPWLGPNARRVPLNAFAYRLAARQPRQCVIAWGSTHRALRPRQLRPPPRQARQILDCCRRTPCTHSAAARAHRGHRRRTPCNSSAADRAHRCRRRRTPCTGSAAAREDIEAAF